MGVGWGGNCKIKLAGTGTCSICASRLWFVLLSLAHVARCLAPLRLLCARIFLAYIVLIWCYVLPYYFRLRAVKVRTAVFHCFMSHSENPAPLLSYDESYYATRPVYGDVMSISFKVKSLLKYWKKCSRERFHPWECLKRHLKVWGRGRTVGSQWLFSFAFLSFPVELLLSFILRKFRGCQFGVRQQFSVVCADNCGRRWEGYFF